MYYECRSGLHTGKAALCAQDWGSGIPWRTGVQRRDLTPSGGVREASWKMWEHLSQRSSDLALLTFGAGSFCVVPACSLYDVEQHPWPLPSRCWLHSLSPVVTTRNMCRCYHMFFGWQSHTQLRTVGLTIAWSNSLVKWWETLFRKSVGGGTWWRESGPDLKAQLWKVVTRRSQMREGGLAFGGMVGGTWAKGMVWGAEMG